MNSQLKEKMRIVVIIGPTASGKSALGEKIAADFNGIIINADARQVYQGLPTLTAAIAPDNTHRLYQFLSLSDEFSFAQYTTLADTEIRAAVSAHKLPIVVGGTGLYVDALLGMVSAAPQVSTAVRTRVKKLTPDQVSACLRAGDPIGAAQIDMKNPRRVSRALEVFWETGRSITEFGKNIEQKYDVFLIGWDPGRQKVLENIRARVEQMWNSGAVDEVRRVRDSYDPQSPGLQTIGVPEVSAYLDGQMGATEAKDVLITHTAQYAKRQMTWFRRNKKVVWYTNLDILWQSLHDFLHRDSPEH